MPILRLVGQLGLDKTGFDAAMTAANKQVASFGSGLKGQLAGAFGAVAFVAFAKSVIETGDALDELSERLGISVGQAQEFSLAAKLGGSDADFFAVRFEKLRAALRKGASSGENPLEVFGIGATTDTASAIQQLATLIQTTGLNAEQATKFVEIFGKGSGKLINVLGDLKTAQGAMKFDPEQIRNLKEAADAWLLFGNNVKVAASNLFFASDINRRVLEDMKSDPEDGVPVGPTLDEAKILSDKAESDELEKMADDLAEDTQKRINEIVKDTATIAEKNRISALSNEERLVELAEEREAIFNRIATTEEERAQKALDIANNEAAIIGLSKEKKEKIGKPDISESTFGRIGVFTGASSSASATANQVKMADSLTKIHDALINKGIIVKDARR